MTHQLLLYKASAGSGKTFNLAREYITLLLQNKYQYRKILAVTFTNKAAEEMKNRILRELSQLANEQSSDHIDHLRDKLDCNENEVRNRAREVLYKLLHDYGRFSVFTIDTFFQQILQAFTREIGLQGGYRLEIEQDQVMQDAIDRMIRSLDEHEVLRQWLISFAYEKMQTGKSWQIRNDLAGLAEELFKESFNQHEKSLFEKLEDHQSIIHFRDQLLSQKNAFEQSIRAFDKTARQLLQQHEITPDDLKGKSRSPLNLFTKFTQGDFTVSPTRVQAITEETAWYSNNSPRKDNIINCLHQGLWDAYRDMIAFAAENQADYFTSTSILKQVYTLGILHTIHRHIYEITREKNIFLLQDTGKLLQEIIGGNDAPFIYEKMGNVYDYLMIDEFQDTSQTQWENFIPLFLNNMSKGFYNLVVGDIKQSIYRWRNSNWFILAKELEATFGQFNIEKRHLQHNWRSLGHIITFNNTFFYRARQLLQARIDEHVQSQETTERTVGIIDMAYEDLFQHQGQAQHAGKGWVQSIFLPTDQYWDETLEQVTGQIEAFQQEGIRASQITILVRRKKEGEAIAAYLYQRKNSAQAQDGVCYDVVSNEVLRIDKSKAVRIIITALELLVRNNDRLLLTTLLHLLRDALPAEEEMHNLFLNSTEQTRKTIHSLLGKLEIRNHSLYEICEQIYARLGLQNQQQEIPYIDKFMDVVYGYTQKHSNDIYAFLQWWKDKGVKEALNVSENQNAITIYTIHKSKGLEFDTVIIPFADWAFDHSSYTQPILWCKLDKAPYNELPIVPMRYMDAGKTLSYDDHLDEKTSYMVDILNVFYVGVTRAKSNLLILAKQINNKTDSKVLTLNQLLLQCFTEGGYAPREKGYTNLADHWNAEQQTFSYGKLVVSEQTNKEENESTLSTYHASTTEKRRRLRIKNHGEAFFDDSPESAGMLGTTLHSIFNKVEDISDFDKEISNAFYEGLITEEQQNALQNATNQILTNKPEARKWFNKKHKTLNEREILTPTGKLYRPDRVVFFESQIELIDYKFGMKKETAHQEQVKHYASLLRKMGYPKVTSYLWYVLLGEINEVTETD